MQKTKQSNTVFRDREVVFFGWDRFSAAKNMAIDDVLLAKADSESKFFIRFYDFDKPAIILGAEDDPNLVDKNSNDVEVCRRITGGRPIYVDKNILAYSIVGPIRNDPVFNLNFITDIHRIFGKYLATSIDDLSRGVFEVSLGNTSSVRIEGKPIAGHGHYMKQNHSFLYHGVIVISPWDVAAIAKLLKMSTEDIQRIGALPNIIDLVGGKKDLETQKRNLVKKFISKLPKENLLTSLDSERIEVIKEADVLLDKKYNHKWIYREDIKLRRDVKFCILYEDLPK